MDPSRPHPASVGRLEMVDVHPMDCEDSDDIESPINPEEVAQLIKAGDKTSLNKILSGYDPSLIDELFREAGYQHSLHLAYECGDFQMMEYLLVTLPSLVDLANQFNLTVLFRAVYDRKLDVVRLLLKYNASVQKTEEALQKANCGYVPLIHTAVQSNDICLIQMIIDAGANLSATCAEGRDFMQHALIHCSAVVRDHLSHHLQNRCNFNYQQPVNMALACNSPKAAMKLLHTLSQTKQTKKASFVFLLFGKNYNQKIAQDFLKQASAAEAIVFCELYGAKLIRDSQCQRGVEVWQWAMNLRWNGVQRILKLPLNTPLESILGVREVLKVEEAEALPVCRSILMAQALLVLQRHLPNWSVFGDFLLDMLGLYIEVESYEQARSLFEFTFNRVILMNSETEGKRLLVHLTKLVEKGKVQVPFYYGLHLMRQLQRLLETKLSSDRYKAFYARHNAIPMGDKSCSLCRDIANTMATFWESLSLLLQMHGLARRSEMKEMKEMRELKTIVVKFMQSCPILRQENLFHTSVINMKPFDPEVVKLLVSLSDDLGKTGFNPEPLHLMRNPHGETPLHILAAKSSGQHLVQGGVIECFLSHGADLCMKSHSGVRVSDVLLQHHVVQPGEVLPSLQCLAARVVDLSDSHELSEHQREIVMLHK